MNDIDNAFGEGTASRFLSILRGFDVDPANIRGIADIFTAIDQATSGDTSRFLRDIEKNTPILKVLTDDVGEVLQLTSNLTNANIKLTNIQTGLTRVQRDAAQQGRSVRDVLADYLAEIEMASTATEKQNIASVRFSETAGPAFVSAVEEGVFQVDSLNDALAEHRGALQSTADEMDTFVSGIQQAWGTFSATAGEHISVVEGYVDNLLGVLGGESTTSDVLSDIGGFAATTAAGAAASGGGLLFAIADLFRARSLLLPSLFGGGGPSITDRGAIRDIYNRNRASAGGVTINVNGPVVGEDAAQQVAQTIVREQQRSGYVPYTGF